MDNERAECWNHLKANRAAHKRIWKSARYVSKVVAADAVANEDWAGYRINGKGNWKCRQELDGICTDGGQKARVANRSIEEPAVVIPPNRLDPPIAQESTAFCASFSLRIDIPDTDQDIDCSGLQCIGRALQQIDSRVDIAYHPQMPYLFGGALQSLPH